MADIKIKASPDEIQQVVGSIMPSAPPAMPPAPPMPTPARAGYGAFASDPLNQSAVSKHITPPGTSILPPPPPIPQSVAAPRAWNPGPSSPLPSSVANPSQMASVNPPKVEPKQWASLNPPQVAPPAKPSIYGGQVDTVSSPQSAAVLPMGGPQAPQTVNPYGTATPGEYFTANPSQQEAPQLVGQGWKKGLLYGGIAALQSAASGLQRGGNPLAGMGYLDNIISRDQRVPEINAQRYRAGVMQPQIDALKAQEGVANVAHTQALTTDVADKRQQELAQHGLKTVVNPDGTTTLAVDPDSPVTKANANKDAKIQAATEYLAAQTASAKAQKELREAQAAYENNKSDPNSLVSKQVAERLATARQNAQTSAGRLNQTQLTYQARYMGVGPDGQPLAGAMITDDGRPVGSTFSANLRPTGTERNKGDMANSADVQLGDIKSIMQKHPQLFGPGYGQSTEFTKWLGSQDPDAQRFMAARTIAADHLAGTFGGRSEAALQALDDAIGQFKDNPKAAIAGIDQLSGANKSFIKAGAVKTAGSNANKANNMVPPPQGGGKAISYKQTASGPGGHKIGSNDGTTWFDVQTGKALK